MVIQDELRTEKNFVWVKVSIFILMLIFTWSSGVVLLQSMAQCC